MKKMANDDILSQEEIEALLKGDSPKDDGGDETESVIEEQALQESSQDEEKVAENSDINSNPEATLPEISSDKTTDDLNDKLTDIERDALGEIGNISMGTAATTLSTLLGKKVNITTPAVTVTCPETVASANKLPVVAIDVSWMVGLEGSNLMLLQSNDAKIIADLMMGQTDGFNLERELTEIDLSAVSEAMNQMMGSASTSLSEMFNRKVDISPPTAVEVTLEESKDKLKILQGTDPLVSIEFRMVVEDLMDTNFVQLFPLEFGKEMVKMLMGESGVSTDEVKPEANRPEPQPQPQPKQEVREAPTVTYQEPYYPPPQYVQPQVVVSQPQFQSFNQSGGGSGMETIDLVGDIPVELSVELGRTNKKIGEILEFNEGTVIELNKLVGETLEIYANGKFIAKGEVVVIDDNFGVRVTEIELSNKNLI